MKATGICITFCAVLAFLPLASTKVRSAEQELSKTAADRLEAVLKDRRDTLAKLVDVLSAQYEQGAAQLHVLLVSQAELLEAELELAKTDDQRIAVLEKRLDVAKKLHDVSERMVAAGVRGVADGLRAKAARLHVEARLLRERAKQGRK